MTSEERLQVLFQKNNYVYTIILVTTEASQTFLGRDSRKAARCEIQFTQRQPYNEKTEYSFPVPLAQTHGKQAHFNFPCLLLIVQEMEWVGTK
jgi:hypothetical protein